MERNNRGLLVVLGVLVLALLIGPVLMGGWMGAGVVGPGMMGWGVSGGGAATTVNGWPWGLRLALGGLMMVAFWGALIAGVVLLVRWATGRSTSPSDAEPLTILRRRYAAGDIDQPTFERMSSELSGSGNGARQPVTTNGRTEVVR